MNKKSLLPFLILGLGFVWAAFFEWLRRRSVAASGTEPGNQMLTLTGMGGLLVCMIAAGVVAYLKWS